MLNPFARSKYRAEVLALVYYYFPFYPGDLLKDFPGINGVINTNYRHRASAATAAALSAADVLVRIVGGATLEGQHVMLTQLENINSDNFGMIIDYLQESEANRLKIFDHCREALMPATVIIAAALTIADWLASEGELTEEDRTMIHTEVVGALHGLSDEERTARRLLQAFERSIGR